MIPPESSGASRTKVAWCNLGRLALVLGRSCPSHPESAGAAVPRDARRRFPRPRVRRRRVVRLHPRPGGPPRVRTPLAPADWSRLPAGPTSAPPLAPAERSRLPAGHTPSGHVPSSEPRPADASRPLDAPHAARPDHSRHRRENQQPLAAPPRDGSHDLGETHAARRATPPLAGWPAPRPSRPSPRRPVTTPRPTHPARSRSVGWAPANRRFATTRRPTRGTS